MRAHPDSTTAGQLRAPLRPALRPSAVGFGAGLAAVALAVMVVAQGSAGTAAVRLVGVLVPVGFALWRLAREPADRFARLLLGAAAVWSLATLAESGNSGLYSLG